MQRSISKRLKTLAHYSQSEEHVLAALAKSKSNVVWWFNNWVWCYEPRNSAKGLPAFVPMNLWPKQVEFLQKLEEKYRAGENLLVEKSRDAGCTYLCAGWADNKFLFEDGFKATFGSRKLELVDSWGDPDSIFEKIRLIHKKLPTWMMPYGWDEKKHSSRGKLLNPERKAMLKGEGGDDMGRGGRSGIYFIDEAASIPRDEGVDAAVSNNSDVVVKVSTPKGMGNQFARDRFSGNVEVFIFKWEDDPRKNQEWYDEMCRKYSPLVVAQEIDRSYSALGEACVIPQDWVRAAVQIDLEPIGESVAGLDVADSGTNLTVYTHRIGPVLTRIESWHGLNTHQSAIRARDLAREDGASVVYYDRGGVGGGVAGPIQAEMDELEEMGMLSEIQFIGIDSGSSPSSTFYDDDPDRPAFDRFKNTRAEMWWAARRRFEKTYEHVQGINSYDASEMISLPDWANDTISQLSLPLLEYAEDRRIRVESKQKMRRQRRIASPDHADSCVLCFANVQPHILMIARAKKPQRNKVQTPPATGTTTKATWRRA